jgi:OmpA-OmpF porin, OOP family
MKKYLVKNGISEDNIDIVGNGTNNPIAENETESGRAKNRRVEISINN